MGFEENTFCQRFLWHWKMLQADPVDGVFFLRKDRIFQQKIFSFSFIGNSDF